MVASTSSRSTISLIAICHLLTLKTIQGNLCGHEDNIARAYRFTSPTGGTTAYHAGDADACSFFQGNSLEMAAFSMWARFEISRVVIRTEPTCASPHNTACPTNNTGRGLHRAVVSLTYLNGQFENYFEFGDFESDDDIIQFPLTNHQRPKAYQIGGVKITNMVSNQALCSHSSEPIIYEVALCLLSCPVFSDAIGTVEGAEATSCMDISSRPVTPTDAKRIDTRCKFECGVGFKPASDRADHELVCQQAPGSPLNAVAGWQLGGVDLGSIDALCIPESPAPTSTPTASPTSSPPTSLPSPTPTNTPTAMPTSNPTPIETGSPTPIATMMPTSMPTLVPTLFPTDAPTPMPTDGPTPAPTTAPTAVPTTVPTSVPTSLPTAVPTLVPTQAPTSVPTGFPTSVPTGFPTNSPTNSPTDSPTDLPTISPTISPTDSPTDPPITSLTNSPSGIPTPMPVTRDILTFPSETPLDAEVNRAPSRRRAVASSPLLSICSCILLLLRA